jgi:hypothetical protein
MAPNGQAVHLVAPEKRASDVDNTAVRVFLYVVDRLTSRPPDANHASYMEA